jgi:hypothetical protein
VCGGRIQCAVLIEFTHGMGEFASSDHEQIVRSSVLPVEPLIQGPFEVGQ